MTGTSSLLFARAKPAFRLAVCLALGALFASTPSTPVAPWQALGVLLPRGNLPWAW
jgi:hypothetical protein